MAYGSRDPLLPVCLSSSGRENKWSPIVGNTSWRGWSTSSRAISEAEIDCSYISSLMTKGNFSLAMYQRYSK